MKNKVLLVSVLLCIAIAGFLPVGVGIVEADTILVSDFDDGTLQGWTPDPAFGGVLFVDLVGGNPNGFMVAVDNTPGGALQALAPAPLVGDLSAFMGIQWDEFIYDNGGATTIGTGILLRGVDGTFYSSQRPLGPRLVWSSRLAPFDDAGAWNLLQGAATFEEVIVNVDALFILMDTSVQAGGARESGIDNVALLTSQPVPEPSTLLLIGTGLVGLVGLRRKFGK